MSQSETQVTATIDPDREWAYAKNANYDHTSWYSTTDGAFEKRLQRESPLDEWTGINWNKIPNQPGEYYGVTNVPIFENEWNEEEYYRNWTPNKTNEQVETELREPIVKLEEKYSEFVKNNEEIVWTPTLEKMVEPSVEKARVIEYEIAPFFQLNKDGYRKNWANVRISEMRPFQRIIHSHTSNLFSDFFVRFQLMRWNLGARIRLRYMKVLMVGCGIGLLLDHRQAKGYRQRWKWH